MAQAPVHQQVFTLDDGDVVITFRANLSRKCVEDLKPQLDLFTDRLRWPTDAARQSYLRGLAELAASEAGS
jgi:hypothetical protein